MQRIQAIAKAHGLRCAAIGGPGSLESLQFLAEDEPTAARHPRQRRVDGSARGLVGGLQVEEWNLHAPHLARMNSA
jgi:hypothetical protein